MNIFSLLLLTVVRAASFRINLPALLESSEQFIKEGNLNELSHRFLQLASVPSVPIGLLESICRRPQPFMRDAALMWLGIFGPMVPEDADLSAADNQGYAYYLISLRKLSSLFLNPGSSRLLYEMIEIIGNCRQDASKISFAVDFYLSCPEVVRSRSQGMINESDLNHVLRSIQMLLNTDHENDHLMDDVDVVNDPRQATVGNDNKSNFSIQPKPSRKRKATDGQEESPFKRQRKGEDVEMADTTPTRTGSVRTGNGLRNPHIPFDRDHNIPLGPCMRSPHFHANPDCKFSDPNL